MRKSRPLLEGRVVKRWHRAASGFGTTVVNLGPLEILVVEDNPADMRFIMDSLRTGRILHNLHFLDSGAEVLAFLRREGAYADAPRPHLILMDLKLPQMDGCEVLRSIKADPSLRTIPVIVLTGSEDDADATRAYGAHANCYVRKPLSPDKFIAVMQRIENFWFHVVQLPPE
ncbi:MAG: response regulator [Planctomycetes bacterium]|nr:response regulator [Planctomycetota bacterium]